MSRPVLAADEKCHYCTDLATTWDHVVPFFRGGRNRIYNRVPACKDCNVAKADRMPACPCDFCIEAVRRWEEDRLIPAVRVYSSTSAKYPFGEYSSGAPKNLPRIEMKPGRVIETSEELEAWIRRTDFHS